MNLFGKIFSKDGVVDFQISDSAYDDSGLSIPLIFIFGFIFIAGPFLVWQVLLPQVSDLFQGSGFFQLFVISTIAINFLLIYKRINLRLSVIIIVLFVVAANLVLISLTGELSSNNDFLMMTIVSIVVIGTSSIIYQIGLREKLTLIPTIMINTIATVISGTIIYDFIEIAIIKTPFDFMMHIFGMPFIFFLISVVPGIFVYVLDQVTILLIRVRQREILKQKFMQSEMFQKIILIIKNDQGQNSISEIITYASMIIVRFDLRAEKRIAFADFGYKDLTNDLEINVMLHLIQNNLGNQYSVKKFIDSKAKYHIVRNTAKQKIINQVEKSEKNLKDW